MCLEPADTGSWPPLRLRVERRILRVFVGNSWNLLREGATKRARNLADPHQKRIPNLRTLLRMSCINTTTMLVCRGKSTRRVHSRPEEGCHEHQMPKKHRRVRRTKFTAVHLDLCTRCDVTLKLLWFGSRRCKTRRTALGAGAPGGRTR